VCATALLLLAAAWRFPVPGYFTGALLFAGTAFARHFQAMLGEAASYAPWISEAFASAGLLYAITLLGFFLRPRPWAGASPFLARRADAILAAVWALLFFLNSVLTFRYEPLGWGPWYTPLLAISAFILILLGLFRADPVFRRLGLASLAVPLVRLFLVDIQDALHRIIAFAAAAALLALLGYLYHRLAARLGQREEQDLGNRVDTRTD